MPGAPPLVMVVFEAIDDGPYIEFELRGASGNPRRRRL